MKPETKSVVRYSEVDFRNLDVYSTHYQHSEHCGNCGERNPMHIIKGLKIRDALRGEKCETCGCNL